MGPAKISRKCDISDCNLLYNQLEDTESETYEDWLKGELVEMGIDWEQDDMDTMEERVIEVGSQSYPSLSW